MRGLVADAGGACDVIVAPATPPGTSALAVVRLTGPPGRTLRVARALAPALPAEPRPWGAHFSRLLDAEGLDLDDAVVLFFPAPRSPTGEEVVEILSHGSPAVVSALLAAACRAGARPARPGEFTRRALANGRMDLAGAEGVARLVAAETRDGARRALGLVRGTLSERTRKLREGTLDALAALEAELDFAEDVPAMRGAVYRRLPALTREAHALAVSGTPAPDRAPVVVIMGRPNTGKSTLFNALVGSDRAIVTAEPGTTRDLVSETVVFGKGRLKLVDTAGIRPAEGEAEEEGVARARRAALEADLLLYLLERGEVTAEDVTLLDGADPAGTLLVASKADLGLVTGVPPIGFDEAVAVSAATGEGVPPLAVLVADRLLHVETGGALLIERHGEALSRAAKALGAAVALSRGESSVDGGLLAAGALREAATALGEITGETATEELLDRIFSSFCVGK